MVEIRNGPRGTIHIFSMSKMKHVFGLNASIYPQNTISLSTGPAKVPSLGVFERLGGDVKGQMLYSD